MVGTPVHRQRVVPGPRPVSEAEDADRALSLDEEAEWVDEATFPDQMLRGPQYWKLDRIEAKVFDMSVPEQMLAYSELLTACNQDGTNKVVSMCDRHYSTDTNNWRIFVEIQHIKYRKMFKTDRLERKP